MLVKEKEKYEEAVLDKGKKKRILEVGELGRGGGGGRKGGIGKGRCENVDEEGEI